MQKNRERLQGLEISMANTVVHDLSFKTTLSPASSTIKIMRRATVFPRIG